MSTTPMTAASMGPALTRSREGGKPIQYEQNAVAYAGADAVNSNHGDAPVAAIEFKRLHQQELAAFVRGVFLG